MGSDTEMMLDIQPISLMQKPYEIISLEDPEGYNRVFRMPRNKSSYQFTRYNKRTTTIWHVTVRRFTSDDGIWRTEITWKGSRTRSFF